MPTGYASIAGPATDVALSSFVHMVSLQERSFEVGGGGAMSFCAWGRSEVGLAR